MVKISLYTKLSRCLVVIDYRILSREGGHLLVRVILTYPKVHELKP